MADMLATPLCPEKLKSGTVLRVYYKDHKAEEKIAGAITILMSALPERDRHRLVLCIGSDRSTGDALGPLVGAYLKQLPIPRTSVWGTLAQPVHALNLEQY